MRAKGSPRRNPSVPTEIRLIGRLAADPEPHGAGVTLTLRVRYGIEVHERTVLTTGGGTKVARGLRAGDLVYVVGHRADEDPAHEVHAPHILARGQDRREESGESV